MKLYSKTPIKKIITEILHHSGTNPKERKEIENEQEAWRTVNAMFEDKEKELRKELNEKDNVINEKDNVINEKDKIIEDLLRKLGDK